MEKETFRAYKTGIVNGERYVDFGCYYYNPYEVEALDDGTAKITWTFSPRMESWSVILKIHDDSWHVLPLLSEVFAFLASVAPEDEHEGPHVQFQDLCKKLEELGFANIAG